MIKKLTLLLLSLFMLYCVYALAYVGLIDLGPFNFLIKSENIQLEEFKNFKAVVRTGGRSPEDPDSLDATLLDIPSQYFSNKTKGKESGEVSVPLELKFLKPDFSSARLWRDQRYQELRDKFPDEKEFTKPVPTQIRVSKEAWSEYSKFYKEYQDRVVRVGIASARDIYFLQELYEGGLDYKTKLELAEQREYFGPLTDYRKKSRIENDLNGTPISYKVGKYGQGLWKYKDGLGRDFITETGNPENELWEYAEYSPVGSRIPRLFFYVPVVPETPNQLYVTCNWNGNIDYLRKSRCSAASNYDNTILYTFSFLRDELIRFRELNERVRSFIDSIVIEKGTYSDMLALKEKLVAEDE